jgi:large subunit ribosomal protein L10
VNKTAKEAVIQSMAERLGRAQALVLTDFTGLKVEQMTELRQQLRDKGFEYVVVKNTLLKRASEGQAASVLAKKLTGPNGLGLSYDDPVGLAKTIVDFAKITPKLSIKVGMLSGKLIGAEQVAELAKMPSHEQLLSMLLGVLQGVPRNLVNLLAAVPRSLRNVLKAIEEQKAGKAA